MANYNLLAQYLKPSNQIVRDRNSAGLLAWAGYELAQPIPTTKPPQDWVEQRLLAERIPTQVVAYTERTIGHFLMSPNTQQSIRDYLNQYNDEAMEISLSDDIAAVLASFMPTFAASEIPQEEVDKWYADEGFA